MKWGWRPIIGVLLTAAAVLIWIPLNQSRLDEGPVVLALTRDHGLHVLDVAFLTILLSAWIMAAVIARHRKSRTRADHP